MRILPVGLSQMGKLSNLRDYFTEDELNEYVSGYIEGGLL